jgi:hypothetical protein
VVRQVPYVIASLMVLLVGVLYPSPAFAKPPPGVPRDKAGVSDFVKVKAGTPVTVLGLSKPGNRPCPECPTDAVVRLPNGDVVVLVPKAINFQTQTVRMDTNAFGPYPPEALKELQWLPGSGGAALLPLLGAVMLIGGGLVLHRLLH